MNIYRYIYSVLALGIIFLTVACSEKYEGGYESLHPSLEQKYLDISLSDNNFFGTAKGGTLILDINTNNSNTAWSISDLPDWISADTQNGIGDCTVTLTVHENTSTESGRNCIFYVNSAETGWEYQIPTTIGQEAATPYLTLLNADEEVLQSGTSLTCKGTANTLSFNILSNCPWSVSVQHYNWLTVSPSNSNNNGAFTVNIAENTSQYERNETIIINYGYSSHTIYVTQMPASVTANVGTLSFSPAAGSGKLNITSEIGWTAQTSASWIDLQPTSGEAGTSEMNISVTQNTSAASRSGVIYIKTGLTNRYSITVNQEGESLTISTALLSFNRGNSSDLAMEIFANVSWEVLSKPEWISLSQTEGNGDAEITVTAGDNPSSNSRSGTLSFSIKDRGQAIATANLIQSGKTISISDAVLQFSDKSGSQAVQIKSDGTWNAGCTDNWVSLLPASGNGDGDLTVGVSENTSYEERTSTINIQLYEIGKSISVQQQSKYFNLTSQEIKFPSKGGSTTLSVSTNDQWTAATTAPVSWLTLTPGNDGDTPTLKIIATDNTTASPRSATIEVNTQGGRKIALSVTQAVRTLQVSQSKLSFFPKGGSSTVNVETDGTYAITSTGDWFSIENVSGSFTVTATENTTKSDRSGSITVKLTDITVGEIAVTLPVTQIKSGSSFNQDGYESDVSWDGNDSSEKGTFSITGFSKDADWNSNQGNTDKGGFENTGFGNDTNWD